MVFAAAFCKFYTSRLISLADFGSASYWIKTLYNYTTPPSKKKQISKTKPPSSLTSLKMMANLNQPGTLLFQR